jgi:hypothetical protein
MLNIFLQSNEQMKKTFGDSFLNLINRRWRSSKKEKQSQTTVITNYEISLDKQ